jgi:hypothetical protein
MKIEEKLDNLIEYNFLILNDIELSINKSDIRLISDSDIIEKL